MRLFESIFAVNQRRVAGDRDAMVPLAEFAGALPIAALTCIDARLNHMLPDMLGIPEKEFIWLRNAGNVITGPLSSTSRSLALACAIKGAKEVAIIGHSDCLVAKTTAMQLLDRLAALGIDRQRLPENLVEYFGLFGTERQNVIRSVECVRASPLIGPKIPVHGLLIDLQTGKLESVVNGYQSLDSVVPGQAGALFKKADDVLQRFTRIGEFAGEELKLPETRIGEVVSTARDLLHRAEHMAAAVQSQIGATGPATTKPAEPPPIIPVAPAPGNELRARLQRHRTAKPGPP